MEMYLVVMFHPLGVARAVLKILLTINLLYECPNIALPQVKRCTLALLEPSEAGAVHPPELGAGGGRAAADRAGGEVKVLK